MKICKIDGCDSKVAHKAMCSAHYQQDRVKNAKPCSVDNCPKNVSAVGLCYAHYRRKRHGLPMDVPLKLVSPRGQRPRCSFETCGRTAVSHGLCGTHRMQRDACATLTPIRHYIQTDDLYIRLRTICPEGNPDECWVWPSATNKGYGMVAVANSKLRGAHIVAWEIANQRRLPEGKVIRHTCDNPPCTNPGHLLLGTHADNVRDKLERGRESRGVTHGLTTLTENQVREIRARYSTGLETQKALGAEFNVTQTTIGNIVRRRTWGHVS